MVGLVCALLALDDELCSLLNWINAVNIFVLVNAKAGAWPLNSKKKGLY